MRQSRRKLGANIVGGAEKAAFSESTTKEEELPQAYGSDRAVYPAVFVNTSLVYWIGATHSSSTVPGLHGGGLPTTVEFHLRVELRLKEKGLARVLNASIWAQHICVWADYFDHDLALSLAKSL